MLAPRQLAINAALESLFGHEINSELASIIRGWISRRSSTRRVEREEREKETYKENIYGARHGLIMLALEIRELFADKLPRAC